MSEPVLEVTDLVKHYPGRGRGQVVHAVDGVSLSIGPGEVLGLVGESGSGKSTIGTCVLRLTEPTSGSVRLAGREVAHLSRRALRPLRREVHMVFQDPFSSLNPRFTVGQIVAEPLLRHRVAQGRDADERAVAMLERVGLRAEMRGRYPHELSGGQRQRVGLARALVLGPQLVVADEPVSALDVSVQASVLNLISDLQRDMGFSCLFITHDLSVVEFLADRIAVMYLGLIVETGSREQIFSGPAAPAAAGGARRRDTEPARAAVRLPLPHPMPDRAGHLRRAGATAGGAGRTAPGGLPLPLGHPPHQARGEERIMTGYRPPRDRVAT
jgi:oligopeptide transport system ATP-binding protein